MGKVTSINSVKHVREGVQLFKYRKNMWCMLRETWKRHYHMSFFTTIVLFFGLLYVVTPFDFDWIPFIGWIDDAFVIYLVIKRLRKETERFIRFKAMERKRH